MLQMYGRPASGLQMMQLTSNNTRALCEENDGFEGILCKPRHDAHLRDEALQHEADIVQLTLTGQLITGKFQGGLNHHCCSRRL